MASNSENSAWRIPATARNERLRLAGLLDVLEADEVPCCNDLEAWWPDSMKPRSSGTSVMIKTCRGRPARAGCLECALAADERCDIWGATLSDERRWMRQAVA